MTIAEKLDISAGRPSGFDYLRIFLAFSVVTTHILPIWLGNDATKLFYAGMMRPVIAFILPMFFALSGFLVTGSLMRTGGLVKFFGLRVLRLLPALAVEIFLSALVIGPIFTRLPMSDYFTGRAFFSYFFNIVGWVHFTLPGVFLDNPHPNVVNEQLWTIPWELDCYIALGTLAFLGITRNRWWFLAAVIGAHCLAIARYASLPPDGWLSVKGYILVLSFLVGVSLYLFKERVKWSASIFVISAIATFTLLIVPHGDFLVSVPAAYATVFLGTTNPARNKIILSGDYSYGLYLYGFPIEQAFASIWPGLNISIIFAIICALGFAALSWWLVEKPALKFRTILEFKRGPASAKATMYRQSV
jgi:peptidoglycan/LPS O-acetylase OafA/YrhL